MLNVATIKEDEPAVASVDSPEYGSRAARIIFGLLIVLSTAATFPLLSLPGIPSFARNNGFILVVLGLLAILLSKGRHLKLGKTLTTFVPFVLCGVLTTILMASILTVQGYTLFDVTPLGSITKGLFWLVFDVAIVFCVSYFYEKSTVASLDKAFDVLLVIVLVVGGIQVGVVLGIPGFSSLFDFINIGGWFSAFENCGAERLTGISSEPAAMSKTLGLLCLPYCYCRATSGGGARYGVAFAALLVLAFMTGSTTVYVTVAFVVLGIAVLNIRKKKSKATILTLCLCCIALLVLFAYLVSNLEGFVNSDFILTLQSVLGKITDTGNQSTAYRNSTIVNDIEIFKDYPIFVVGDGNQGFFYAQNLPSWVLASGSTEALSALSGRIGILNGGAFLPSILSGYGVLGCVLFGGWIVACVRLAFLNKERMGHYYLLFIVAMFALIPICWMAEGFQGAPVVVFLIFCMPTLGERR